MTAKAPIWLFDSECMLCSCAVRYVLKHEFASEIRFVSIKSLEGRTLAARNGIDPENPETFLFVEDGRALAKSDGVLALLRHVGGPARYLRLASVLPRPIRDLAYDTIARNRYQLFGKTNFCHVPQGAEQGRFVFPEL